MGARHGAVAEDYGGTHHAVVTAVLAYPPASCCFSFDPDSLLLVSYLLIQATFFLKKDRTGGISE